MKMVVAIIRPERLPCVQLALETANAELMTVTETHSYGQGEGHTLIYRTSDVRVRSAPKLRLEILTEDYDADEVVDAILKAALPKSANARHDGRVFVVALDTYVDAVDREPAALAAHSR